VIYEHRSYILLPGKKAEFIETFGSKIMPPEFLIEYRPDITFVMNPIYFDEIQKTIKEMQVSTELISIK